MRRRREREPRAGTDDDRQRTGFAAALSAVGAVMFVAGALLAKLAGLLIPWGLMLLTFGGVAVIQAVLIGLGLLALPKPPGEGEE